MTDAIVRQAGRGEQAAIVGVLDALHGELAALIRQARISSSDHDDAAQDAVMIVMACCQSYDRNLGTFRAYVCVSVRKMLLKFRRLPFATSDCLPDVPYESNDSALTAEDALAVAPHADIVRDYFGIGRQERSVNQIAASRRLAPKTVRAAITESLQVMREVTK